MAYMMAGIMAGQARPVSAGAALWTPLNMTVVPQIYLDAHDSVVTDVSGACSAISNLGAMGSSGSFSQATADGRPAILTAELNGNRVLSFDGVDDVLTGGAAQQLSIFTNMSAAWSFFVYKKRNVDPSGNRLLLSTSIGGSAGTRFGVLASLSSALNQPVLQGRRLDADALSTLALGSTSAGNYALLLADVNFSTRVGRLQLNGSAPVLNSTFTAATGATSNTTASAPMAICATAGGLVPGDIDLAAVIISNTYPSAGDIDKLFGWAAHKYGLTANLPGGHPYKTVAPTV